jgi:hypothetical protein
VDYSIVPMPLLTMHDSGSTVNAYSLHAAAFGLDRLREVSEGGSRTIIGHVPHRATGTIAIAAPVNSSGLLAASSKQSLEALQYLGDYFLRNLTDAGRLPRPPVQALYLVRPHHASYGASVRN